MTAIMSTPSGGSNLIFLVSQPRAGSTLLQRMLGAHPDIHTTTEPWVMLHPCYGLKREGATADFGAGGWAWLAVEAFLKEAGGREAYVEALRAFGSSMYASALAGSGKTRFLDKTPRYYEIIPELAEVFPGARFILLYRNPLAVVCSICRTWVEGHWERLTSYRRDLLEAPGLLMRGREALGSRALTLRYEELVHEPERVLRASCTHLGLAYVPAMKDGMNAPGRKYDFGDPVNAHQSGGPVSGRAEDWARDLDDPTIWRLANDYLTHLEQKQMLLGYDARELRRTLDAHRPGIAGRWAAGSPWRYVDGRRGGCPSP